MSWRVRMTRIFIWISVLAWGILLGAKLFDLRVLVGAWSASPPESLSLLPYGPHYPVDTGDFFIPISAALLVASFGALISSWRTPPNYRVWLILPTVMILGSLIFTVVAFWPRNAALWAVAKGSPTAIRDSTAVIRMVREWVMYDWLRVAMGVVGFVSAIRAISVPFPAQYSRTEPAPRAMKILYGVGIGAVLIFLVYFVSAVF
jgi:hypothetical protein